MQEAHVSQAEQAVEAADGQLSESNALHKVAQALPTTNASAPVECTTPHVVLCSQYVRKSLEEWSGG